MSSTEIPRRPRGRRRKYSLAQRDRAIELVRTTDLTYRQIGEAVGVPEASVKNWIATSRREGSKPDTPNGGTNG